MCADVVVVGSLNIDLVVRTKALPRPGETIIASQLQAIPGGKGANQAVAAARLGAHVSLIGRVGADAYGEQLRQAISQEGVEVSGVLREEGTSTGLALIVVEDSGQNMIVVVSGANARLAPADINAAATVIAEHDVLLLQLETPMQTVARAAEVAHRHGLKTILNPSPACNLPDELWPLVDVLVANESEAGLLAGVPIRSQEDAERAAIDLARRGACAVVITLGKHGALAIDGASLSLLPAFDVPVVDTTAAGDAFVAGLAVALVEGRALADAVRWGNAAGALACTRMGAQPSLPSRVELLSLLGEADPRSQGREPAETSRP